MSLLAACFLLAWVYVCMHNPYSKIMTFTIETITAYFIVMSMDRLLGNQNNNLLNPQD